MATDPVPEVFLEDFADSAMAIALVYWVELGDQISSRRVDSDLRHAIYARLASPRLVAAGITIPFPQRDVQVTISKPVPVQSTRERYLGASNGN